MGKVWMLVTMAVLAMCMVVGYVGGAGCTTSPEETTPLAEKAPPVAQISASTTDEDAHSLRTFSAVGSTDPDGNIISYQWDFDDGDTASGVTVTHAFSDAWGGVYEVTVTVTDNDGLSDTAAVTVFTFPGGT